MVSGSLATLQVTVRCIWQLLPDGCPRAIRRCGELLKQFDGRGGDRSKSDATDTFALTQSKAAADAGLSKRQQVTAVRVANVPSEIFEAPSRR